MYPASSLKAKQTIVEIGPGRGDFLFHLAEQNKDAVVIGIEIKRKRVDKLIKRVEKRELKNVVTIQDDARRSLKNFLQPASIDAIYINFPDPWPKKRHTKNRLISASFIKLCCNVLKNQAKLYFTTDFEKYALSVAETFKEFKEFNSFYPEIIRTSSDDAFPTFFAQKWISAGRTIYYQKYIKI